MERARISSPSVTDPSSCQRRFGVLLPVSSLPGPNGIGTLGEPANHWLEWLRRAGASIWQLLPLGPTGYGHSPYSSLSSFAGNPWLVSTEALARDGWIDGATESATELEPHRIDYEAVARSKRERLRAAWRSSRTAPAARRSDLAEFREATEQREWLDDWALFAALKRELGGRSWLDWPAEIRLREGAALDDARTRLSDEIDYQTFVQFLFFDQLAALRRRARELGIELIGDLPFYPALDSADVWSRPELFDLDAAGRPRRVAGVPPDAFTDTGQLWGNPLYLWRTVAATRYRWWIERVRANLRFADRLRLDHFRGFSAYWAVPGDADTAAAGRWCRGPGPRLFEAVREALGSLPFVAEDLGLITETVRRLRTRLGIPGMRVLQFAFATPLSEHLPDRVPPDTVIYTGTHDNDTTRGWFEHLEDAERRRVLDYVEGSIEEIHWDLLRVAMASPADCAVAPVQDILGLGSSARLNFPGHSSNQWTWRLRELPDECLAERLGRLVETSGRRPPPPEAQERR